MEEENNKKNKRRHANFEAFKTELSMKRTALSFQRTFLSYISTACVFVSLAFTYLKIAAINQIDWFVVSMFCIGLLFLVFGITTYRLNYSKLKKLCKRYKILDDEDEID